MGRGGRTGVRGHRDAGPVLALSLGVARVGGWQGPAGASRSVLAELHRFYSLEPPRLRTGGGAGRRARHPAVTQEPELQRFGQRLSGVHRCKLYLQLTGASRWFFQLISVKAGSDPESIKEGYRSQMQ